MPGLFLPLLRTTGLVRNVDIDLPHALLRKHVAQAMDLAIQRLTDTRMRTHERDLGLLIGNHAHPNVQPSEFSGLQLLCVMYVAFQIVAPGADTGFDVSREYQSALNLFSARKRKGG